MTSPANDVVARLLELSALGRYDGGIDRGLATPPERAARERFAYWARRAGFTLSQDVVGNLFARRSGMHDVAPIVVGSHLDTVRTGGAYDGAYGVVGALCALQILDRDKCVTTRPVEAVAWAGEEGSRFPLGCLGSSVFAGLTSEGDALALRDNDGISLNAALQSRESGSLPDVPVRPRQETAAYLELHVEQGPVLEAAGVSLGVVTAIAAQRRYRAIVKGASGHAGTVPMERRSDALCGAADIVLAVEREARSSAGAVATVGHVKVEPNGTNIIPLRVSLSVDIRSSEDARVEHIERALQTVIAETERRRGVQIALERLEVRAAAPMDARLRAALHRSCAAIGQPALDITSGAGHDATCLSRVAPAAMLFVPSVGGVSHIGAERTEDRDLELGVAVLAAAIIEVDRDLGQN
ncbi:MAG: Zn-dependent hydrolase [Candidatus Eremiobacteraeota bacterium]|nr:Zn-dependent hydrolase [Candidatus Eremiobacteraeota bacterium]